MSVTQRPPIPFARFEQREALFGGGDTPRGRDPGGAGADDHHVDFARGRHRAERGRRDQRGGGGQETSAG